MEEKQEKKPEFKGNLGFIWLIGILVILLGCVTIYTLKITADNKELKQAQPQSVQQAITTDSTKAEETVKAENTTSEEKASQTKATSDEQKTTYSYKSIEGYYTGKDKEHEYQLHLFKEGMYKLQVEEKIAGVIETESGNFIIEDGKVILTPWLYGGSDAGATFYNKVKQTTYKINSNNSIGNLKKKSSKVNNDVLKNLSGLAQNKEKLIY